MGSRIRCLALRGKALATRGLPTTFLCPMRDLSLSRSQLLLLAGTANRPLAEEMAQHLGQPLCAVTLRRFADGELFVKIDENVRGRMFSIIRSRKGNRSNLRPPVNS